MSRHAVTVRSRSDVDDRAVIGYDAPMRTYFLQAFRRRAKDCPELWLGTRFDEFPSLASLTDAARTRGCAILALPPRAVMDMEGEARQPHRRSLAERCDLVLP